MFSYFVWPHHMYSIDVAYCGRLYGIVYVSLCMCWAYGWSLWKWLNQLRCRFGRRCVWVHQLHLVNTNGSNAATISVAIFRLIFCSSSSVAAAVVMVMVLLLMFWTSAKNLQEARLSTTLKSSPTLHHRAYITRHAVSSCRRWDGSVYLQEVDKYREKSNYYFQR